MKLANFSSLGQCIGGGEKGGGGEKESVGEKGSGNDRGGGGRCRCTAEDCGTRGENICSGARAAGDCCQGRFGCRLAEDLSLY